MKIKTKLRISIDASRDKSNRLHNQLLSVHLEKPRASEMLLINDGRYGGWTLLAFDRARFARLTGVPTNKLPLWARPLMFMQPTLGDQTGKAFTDNERGSTFCYYNRNAPLFVRTNTRIFEYLVNRLYFNALTHSFADKRDRKVRQRALFQDTYEL